MLTVVLHYRETGILAAPPTASAHYAPAQAWIEAHNLKQRHPGDRITVMRGGETEVEAGR